MLDATAPTPCRGKSLGDVAGSRRAGPCADRALECGRSPPRGPPSVRRFRFRAGIPVFSVVGEPYRGHGGFEQWARDLDEQFAEWSIGLDDIRQVGNQVITISTIDARGRASDVRLRFRSASVFDFGNDDRVTRLRIYSDVDEALRAVGMR